MKTKAVRSQRIAWLLRKEGFKILGITPNRKTSKSGCLYI